MFSVMPAMVDRLGRLRRLPSPSAVKFTDPVTWVMVSRSNWPPSSASNDQYEVPSVLPAMVVMLGGRFRTPPDPVAVKLRSPVAWASAGRSISPSAPMENDVGSLPLAPAAMVVRSGRSSTLPSASKSTDPVTWVRASRSIWAPSLTPKTGQGISPAAAAMDGQVGQAQEAAVAVGPDLDGALELKAIGAQVDRAAVFGPDRHH